MPGNHAKLSPSSAKRWMTCTGSLDLEPTQPDTDSPYASAGTRLHGIAEACLREGRQPTELDALEGETVQFYIDYVRNLVHEVKGDLYVEQRLRHSEDLWGTADAVITSPSVLDIVDLKTGRIKVYAHNNEQFWIYASMARREFESMYSAGYFKTIRMHCVQSSIDHVDVWEITAADLDTLEVELQASLDQIKAGHRVYVPSEDACRFCRGKAVCRARAEQNFATAVQQFRLAEPPALSINEIAELLPNLKQIADWTKAIQEYALTQAAAGGTIPGYKLVAGRSVRVWKNDDDAAQAMVMSGIDENKVYNRKIIGLGDAERMLGKKHPLFIEQTKKAEAAPALVPDSDKRPALDFNSEAAVAEMISSDQP